MYISECFDNAFSQTKANAALVWWFSVVPFPLIFRQLCFIVPRHSLSPLDRFDNTGFSE